jgi:hypothetical protein
MRCPWYDSMNNICVIKKSKEYCKGHIVPCEGKVEVYCCSIDPKAIRIGTRDEIIMALPKLGISLDEFLKG